MPLRLHFVHEQIGLLLASMAGGGFVSLAAADLDLISAEQITGNQFLLVMVAGALGGAFVSAWLVKQTAHTLRSWAGRMVVATITSIVSTPAFFHWTSLPHNAAAVLCISALMALFWKLIIKAGHDWLISKLGKDTDGCELPKPPSPPQ